MTISEAGQGTSREIEADDDPIETREWLDSIDAIVRYRGPERALFLLHRLETWLRDQGVSALQPPYSAYRNTIPPEKQGAYTGNLAIEQRLTSIIRWNALAMVMRANLASGNSAAISRATPPRRKSSRPASTTSSAPWAKASRAISSFSSPIPRRASMRAPSLKGA
jgi:hypothetical protein